MRLMKRSEDFVRNEKSRPPEEGGRELGRKLRMMTFGNFRFFCGNLALALESKSLAEPDGAKDDKTEYASERIRAQRPILQSSFPGIFARVRLSFCRID